MPVINNLWTCREGLSQEVNMEDRGIAALRNVFSKAALCDKRKKRISKNA